MTEPGFEFQFAEILRLADEKQHISHALVDRELRVKIPRKGQ